MNPSSLDISGLLVQKGIGVFGFGDWQITQGMMPPDAPDRRIAIYDTKGFTPNPKWNVDYPMVMVHVRGSPVDYLAAWQKAVEIKNALLGMPTQEINGTHYGGIMMLGDIGDIGRDENKRPVFSLNFRLMREGTGGYRE